MIVLGSDARGLSITFDYSRDTTGFFNDPTRRSILNMAATSYEGFADSLLAITPSTGNTWTESFAEPTTGLTATLTGGTVAANTLVVYVGARDLPGSTLGQGGPGGFGYSANSQAFANAVSNRGQTGDTNNSAATDFASWGGSIAFDSLTNWYFGTSISGLGGSQSDFLSVAIHELGHVLGFGTAQSFQRDISGTNFIGPAAEAKHGGTAVPLSADLGHWLQGTMSQINSGRAQETEMDPALTQGTRKIFTNLDYAAMTDIGWQVRLPGDANGDGKINADDYALIDRGFDKHLTGWTNGDFNADGVINSSDYLIIDREFGNQTGVFDPGLLAEREAEFGDGYVTELVGMVPEPSMVLMAMMVVGVGRKRSRRSRSEDAKNAKGIRRIGVGFRGL
jgi:hypothetical protein